MVKKAKLAKIKKYLEPIKVVLVQTRGKINQKNGKIPARTIKMDKMNEVIISKISKLSLNSYKIIAKVVEMTQNDAQILFKKNIV